MKRLLLVAVMVLVSLVGMVSFSRAAESQNDTPTMSAMSNTVSTLQEKVNDGVSARAKRYYLTASGFTDADAITACDSGFHIASISEIQNPSNLQFRGTPAFDSPAYDQKLGPPLDTIGWVRSGGNVQPEIGHEVDYGVYYEADYKIVPKDIDYGVYYEADYGAYYGLEIYYSVYQSLSDPQHQPELRCSALWYDARSSQPASDPTVTAHVIRDSCSQPERVWCVEDPK